MKVCVQALTDHMGGKFKHKKDLRKWGDYWFKRHIRGAFELAGVKTVTKTGWADVSLNLQGQFWASKSPVRAVWVCGNVKRIKAHDYKHYYDLVYTLSDKYTEILTEKGVECKTMLPVTEDVYEPLHAPTEDLVYMGALKDGEYWDRYTYIAALSEAKMRVNVVGDGWKKYRFRLPYMNRLYTYHPHKYYRDLFSTHRLGLYIHAPDMKEWEFVALRVLDMLASGNTLVISDYNKGIEKIFGDVIPMFKSPKECLQLVKYFLKNEEERKERLAKARQIILDKRLTYGGVAERMIPDFERALNEKNSVS